MGHTNKKIMIRSIAYIACNFICANKLSIEVDAESFFLAVNTRYTGPL